MFFRTFHRHFIKELQGMKILVTPKEQSDTANRKSTDNVMTKKKDKTTSNDIENTTQKTKD